MVHIAVSKSGFIKIIKISLHGNSIPKKAHDFGNRRNLNEKFIFCFVINVSDNDLHLNPSVFGL